MVLNDEADIDVSGEILDPTVVYKDEDALQFASLVLGLEFPEVAVEVQSTK